MYNSAATPNSHLPDSFPVTASNTKSQDQNSASPERQSYPSEGTPRVLSNPLHEGISQGTESLPGEPVTKDTLASEEQDAVERELELAVANLFSVNDKSPCVKLLGEKRVADTVSKEAQENLQAIISRRGLDENAIDVPNRMCTSYAGEMRHLLDEQTSNETDYRRQSSGLMLLLARDEVDPKVLLRVLFDKLRPENTASSAPQSWEAPLVSSASDCNSPSDQSIGASQHNTKRKITSMSRTEKSSRSGVAAARRPTSRSKKDDRTLNDALGHA